MSFKNYLKEQEELQIVQAEEDSKSKLVNFIKTIENLNDEKFRQFAVDELGMTSDEAETVVYKMLRDFLLTNDDGGAEISDEVGLDDLGGLGDELGGLGDTEDVGDEFGDDIGIGGLDDEEDVIGAELGEL